MKLIFQITLALIFAALITGKAQSRTDKQQILQTLEKQTSAWNKGDLKAFMNGYWQSDSLKFIGKNGITYGWERTLNNYIKSYPDKASMGKLRFDILHIEPQSPEVYTVIGKWHLQRQPAKEDLQGYFSLVWKKINDQWVIIMDHSS